jgi:hypothetical protein
MGWHQFNPAVLFSQRILVFAFCATVLFLAGPQIGSLDADEDGFPEVPVAVAETGPIIHLSISPQQDRQPRTRRTSVLAFIAARPYRPGAQRSTIELLASIPQASVVLRC